MTDLAPSRTDAPTHVHADTRAKTPIAALMRYWPLAVVLVIVGAVAGVALADRTPPLYTAEARVAVGEGDLSAGGIAGLPQAAELLASNYARYISDQGLVGGNAGAENAAISASPIPKSNIIRVQAVSTDPDDARTSAGQVAADLVAQVNGRAQTSDGLQAAYRKAAQVWATATVGEASAQRKLDELETRRRPSPGLVTEAQDALSLAITATQTAELLKNAAASRLQTRLTSSAAADLVVVAEAQDLGSDRGSRVQRDAVGGVVVGGLLSLVLAVALDRRRGRRSVAM